MKKEEINGGNKKEVKKNRNVKRLKRKKEESFVSSFLSSNHLEFKFVCLF